MDLQSTFPVAASAASGRPYRVILWGCSLLYNIHYPVIRRQEELGEIRVAGVYDRTLLYGSTIDGYPILRKEELPAVPHDFLLVLVNKEEKSVIEEYLALGGRRENVIPCRVLDIPNLSIRQWAALRDARFSIFSKVCYGGILSWQLGFEHLSPTKNLWMHSRDYFSLLSDLPHYLKLTPRFSHYMEGNESYDQPVYPVLTLGDLRLYCNHDSDPDEAIRKWTRRAAKVNLDRLLMTYLATSEAAMEQFFSLPVTGRKVCFTTFQSGRPGTLYLPPEKETPLDMLHWTAGRFNTLVDIPSLFSGEVRNRRK